MTKNINSEKQKRLHWYAGDNYVPAYIEKYKEIYKINEDSYDDKTGNYHSQIIGNNLIDADYEMFIDFIQYVVKINDFNLFKFLGYYTELSEGATTGEDFFYYEKSLLHTICINEGSSVEIVFSPEDAHLNLYYPEDNPNLFEEFASLGERLLKHLQKIDSENLINEIKNWVSVYGGLTNPVYCIIYTIICKSIVAYVLNDIYKLCTEDDDLAQKKLKNFLSIGENCITLKHYFELDEEYLESNPFRGYYESEDIGLINYLNVPVKFDGIKKDETPEYYKKIGFLYLGQITAKIMGSHKMTYYSGIPEAIKGRKLSDEEYLSKGDYNETGCYVEVHQEFTNLEQVIFNQFLERLKFYPDKRMCEYCKIRSIKIETKLRRKTRRDKAYCSDSCRAMASRKRNPK